MATGPIHHVALWATLVAAAIGCLGCGTSPSATSTSAAVPGSTDPSAAVSTTPSLTTPGVGGPPAAAIRVEGGDAVDGQLGTYDWAGGGSASPWLPGTAVAVGGREILTVTVAPAVTTTEWTARLAPASDVDGVGVVVGSGVGAPVISAPAGGSWTLAVTVGFGEAGSATYFWRLDVS